MRSKAYFISGIDTGIGKTVATGLIARSLANRGVDAITVKMVQTGNVGFSEDLAVHRAMCGAVRFPEDEAGLTAPQIFAYPASPLLAAAREGRTVDLSAIASAVAACAAAHDIALVEGAGGLAVPLTEETLAVDFAAAQGWPLILVTCGRLGAINHLLLSLDAAHARGMRVAGIVHNSRFSADAEIDADAEAAARRWLSAHSPGEERFVRIPSVPSGGPFPDIDFSGMFA